MKVCIKEFGNSQKVNISFGFIVGLWVVVKKIPKIDYFV